MRILTHRGIPLKQRVISRDDKGGAQHRIAKRSRPSIEKKEGIARMMTHRGIPFEERVRCCYSKVRAMLRQGAGGRRIAALCKGFRNAA